MHMNKGFALSMLDRHQEAVEALKSACHSDANNFWPQLGLAIVLAHDGRLGEAADTLNTAMKYDNVYSRLSDIETAFSSASEHYRKFLTSGARMAGMPE